MGHGGLLEPSARSPAAGDGPGPQLPLLAFGSRPPGVCLGKGSNLGEDPKKGEKEKPLPPPDGASPGPGGRAWEPSALLEVTDLMLPPWAG